MAPQLVFGWRTALLLAASVQMGLIALALWQPIANRSANRSLSCLLVAIVGVITPDTIGFAGFYDRFPWLSFAPFAVPLAIGPLLYGYTHAIGFGRLPHRFALHLAPAGAQFLYQLAIFVQPLPRKAGWDATVTPYVEPLLTLALLMSLAGYAVASLRLLTRYRGRLAQERSDDDRLSARWLSRAVTALLLLMIVWFCFEGWSHIIAPLDYFGDVGRYLATAFIGCYLAVEGWRHAARPSAAFVWMPVHEPVAASRDWAATGEAWAAEVRAGQWYRDPELSIGRLARMLGTNSGYLSRALNQGLSLNFSTFIARLRCEAVADALRAGSKSDLVDLALDAGFGSKATFNRAFRARFGQSPSAFRRLHGSDPE
ncbi:helix-turn-helix domain-containing protein [Sphingomonas sp.]|uniref:helix-turn-helix domain-containing protein n=1 Tax=Sphingomonas sp. TaxID=28214 RepID=UPI003B3B43A9